MTVNPVCGCLAFYLGTAGDLRYKTEVVGFLCCEVAANAWKECGSKRTGCTASTMGGALRKAKWHFCFHRGGEGIEISLALRMNL